VAGLLALSLLAKPMWVTLPFLLLLLDVWPLQRWAGSPVPVDPEPPPSPRVGARRLVVEKLPLMALSAASAVLTLVAQTRGGAVTGGELGLSARLGNAAVACVRYVGKTFWPWPLAVHYPHPGDALPAWQALAATAAVIGATAAAVALGRRAPWLAVGWLWFLGTLVPVIGLVQVGAQAMADRYTYLPTIGIFLIVSWGATALAARVGRRRAWGVLAAAALVALSATTWRQLDFWSDHVALFRHALEVEPPSGVALGALSEGLRRQGNLDEALLRAQQAVELAPGTARHWNNLGIGYRDLGHLAEARQALLEATRIDPRHSSSWLNLGLVEMDLGRVPEAMAAYERGLALGAETPSALANLALLYAAAGRIPEADWAFERSARLDPGSAAAWSNLGVFRGREGRWSEALEALERAAQLDPGNGAIRQRLEEARRRAGR
jgi:tetratricopeptide (TPR) repeat protein